MLLDLIEAPDYYLSYLHDRWHLEKILIGSEKSESLYQDIAENTALNLFYTGISKSFATISNAFVD